MQSRLPFPKKLCRVIQRRRRIGQEGKILFVSDDDYDESVSSGQLCSHSVFPFTHQKHRQTHLCTWPSERNSGFRTQQTANRRTAWTNTITIEDQRTQILSGGSSCGLLQRSIRQRYQIEHTHAHTRANAVLSPQKTHADAGNTSSSSFSLSEKGNACTTVRDEGSL